MNPPIINTKYGRAFLNKQGYYYLPKYANGKPMNLHRVIFADHIGRRIPRAWEVHHINGCRTDNRVENLVALHKGDHRLLHI